MGTPGNGDCQWACRSVLKDFTEDALTISAGSLFQNVTDRIVKTNWRRRVQHRCWWNLQAQPFAGWMCEGGRHGEFQETMGNREHGYLVSTDSLVGEEEQTKLFEGCFIRDMPKPFHDIKSELLHLFQCLGVKTAEHIVKYWKIWRDFSVVPVLPPMVQSKLLLRRSCTVIHWSLWLIPLSIIQLIETQLPIKTTAVHIF